MKKVFHIITHFDLGGAEAVALNIAKSPSPHFEYHLVEVIRGRSGYTQQFVDTMKRHGIRYHRAVVPLLFSYHYIMEKLLARLFPIWFLFLFLRHRPDVIHAHTEIPDIGLYTFFKLFPRLKKRCKVVRTIHNTQLWTGTKHLGAKVERFYQSIGANVAISKSVQTSYLQQYGETPTLVFNGVEIREQKPYPHLHQDKVNILFAGRFEPQKGVSVLVEIVKSLHNDGRYFFHILGEGSLQPMLDELAPLSNVAIGPPLYGISQYLGSFDYLLMPSLFEGLSMLSIEASFARLPVIINASPGLSDTLPPDWDLRVTDNKLEHYEHIFRTLLPKTDRVYWGNRAFAFVQNRFSMSQMWQGYEQKYEESYR